MSEQAFTSSMRKRRLITCRHFTGIQHESCAAGVAYASVRKPHPTGHAAFSCIRDDRWEELRPECDRYVATTEDEVDAEEKAYADAFSKIEQGVSPCCDAPVQPMGSGVGCSKCRRLLMTQCRKVKR